MRLTGTKPIALLLGCLLLLTALLPSCAPAGEGSGEAPSASDTGAEETAFPAPSGTAQDETQSAPQTEPETQPEQKEKIPMDIYGNGYNANMIVGFDEQGHLVDAVRAERSDKQVGIFYFLWLGQPFAEDIYDASVILDKYGVDTLLHEDVPGISPALQPHWWGKPLFGYYNSADYWVIRRHMELLTAAGVDFLVFDTTNAVTYDQTARRVMKVICELRAEGWDCPQTVYYTHTRSIQTVNNLYQSIYSDPDLSDAWYRVDGKPMIIAYTDAKTDMKVSGDSSYTISDLDASIRDFFYIRTPQWPDEDPIADGWPYTDWKWPQSVQTDMISVSIATHPMPPFSFSLTHENWGNRGRGFDVRTKKNVHADIMKGTFYDAEWETVYLEDPRFVFVTGWNEWVAWKQLYLGEYMLCDNADMEYSRDAEPMEGGYEDAYYIQTVQRIRQFKYLPIDGYIASSVRKSIDVNASAAQWDEVNAVYRRVGTDDGERDFYGASKTVSYTQPAARNGITEVRVTADAENVYFLIRCDGDITAADTTDWMNLFIGRGRPAEGKGWEGYEFAVNRTRRDGWAAVETLNADFTGTTVGEAAYTVQGCDLQISIPRALLGLEGENDFYFKVADRVEEPAEIMSYYATGRSLPLGRLSYLYQLPAD